MVPEGPLVSKSVPAVVAIVDPSEKEMFVCTGIDQFTPSLETTDQIALSVAVEQG